MINFTDFSKLHHSITLLGMSGIGKTVLSMSLRNSANWFHYSADYRIGTRYLSEHILDNVKFKIMQMSDPFVADLLKSDSIYINHNISVDNLRPVSTFLGMYGDDKLGGLDKNTFLVRQELYRQAEISAMLDINHFMSKAWEIYRCPNFINDASGSLCEIVNLEISNDDVLRCLSDQTLIVYIQADNKSEKKMIERAYAQPKPLYYNHTFLSPLLENMPEDGAGVSPIKFARNCFPSLMQYRKPKYDKISSILGFKVPIKDLFWSKDEKETIPNSIDFLQNLYTTLKSQIKSSTTARAKFEKYLEACLKRQAMRENS